MVTLESLMVPSLAIGIGMAFHPEDPLGVNAAFHWAWLAPIIVALRYGPLAGLGAAAVLLLAWVALHQDQMDQFPQIFFLGGLITVMLVGEFSSLWRARTRRAESVQYYLDQRLEHLIRQYYLLRLSHDRLEQELIGRPMSMRDALKTLRGLSGGEDGAQILLRLLAQYCQISSAAVHPVNDDKLEITATATIGSPVAVDIKDPLLAQAMETRTLCHVVQATVRQEATRYLVAAPLLDIGGEIYAMLLIDELPFFALQDENLQTINLLLGYYTDGLSTQALAAPLLEQVPICPPEFAFELQRLWRMHQSTKVPSIVVALEFTQDAAERDLPQQFLRLKRMMDESWVIAGSKRQVIAILMPLGDASTAEGFIGRLEEWIQRKQHTSLAQAGIYPHPLPLADSDGPLPMLQKLLQLAHA
ncbi:PelD GGDEF domain-containing protein [Acidovorax sp. DW039]|uniref:PelD GGDEF domain-containing protein n=1 Tax=Acidovorax sp. DW039 TaxID=3095606 RepID=UPI0030D46461